MASSESEVRTGILPMTLALQALGKPRAVAGKQVLMPANNAKRATIQWGLLALWLGAGVVFVLHLAGNLKQLR